MQNSKAARTVVLTALLLAAISLTAVTPVRSQPMELPKLDLTASPPCACSTGAVYTFHVENPNSFDLSGIDVTIPAGYAINPAYLTTTPGIVVATGVWGSAPPWPPYTPSGVVEIKTTTTSGVFELFVDGISKGTGTYTPPTATTPGEWKSMFPTIGPTVWGEVSFVAGFIINPCKVGTYSWSPNTAYYGAPYPMEPRTGYSDTVTIVDCAVAGELVAVPKMTVIAALAPWFGLAVLVSIVTAIGLERKKREVA
ncbi:hypothetical protein KEJ39_03970 [Candidatus Bathyarchaeota archaeon]|nr:hypothetical protein [Candidatus Bathyarchaeota archaeon]